MPIGCGGVGSVRREVSGGNEQVLYHERNMSYAAVYICQNSLNDKLKVLPWLNSVNWVMACELKGCWFESLSGHMPGL